MIDAPCPFWDDTTYTCGKGRYCTCDDGQGDLVCDARKDDDMNTEATMKNQTAGEYEISGAKIGQNYTFKSRTDDAELASSKNKVQNEALYKWAKKELKRLKEKADQQILHMDTVDAMFERPMKRKMTNTMKRCDALSEIIDRNEDINDNGRIADLVSRTASKNATLVIRVGMLEKVFSALLDDLCDHGGYDMKTDFKEEKALIDSSKEAVKEDTK